MVEIHGDADFIDELEALTSAGLTGIAVQGRGGTVHSIDPRYRQWIGEYAQRNKGWLTAACAGACAEMQKAFPELRLVRGAVALAHGTRWDGSFEPMKFGAEDATFVATTTHWWLETETGEIVDPTDAQFTQADGCYQAKAVVVWHPFDEEEAEQLPTGKCPNCGGYCYEGRDFCDDDCARAYTTYIMRECRL